MAAGRSRRVFVAFTCSFILTILIYNATGQATGDGKRKASEYFCVAQCLGLLNPNGPANAATCYGGSGSPCSNFVFLNMTGCCKDQPQDFLKNLSPESLNKCKTVSGNTNPVKMLMGYVLNSATNDLGRLDAATPDGITVRKMGKQMCFIECAFIELKLMKPDGSINYEDTQKAFAATITQSADFWKPSLSTAFSLCKDLMAASYGSLPPKVNNELKTPCAPQPMLLQQCVRRALLLIQNCPFPKIEMTQECKDLDANLKNCDPYAKQ